MDLTLFLLFSSTISTHPSQQKHHPETSFLPLTPTKEELRVPLLLPSQTKHRNHKKNHVCRFQTLFEAQSHWRFFGSAAASSSSSSTPLVCLGQEMEAKGAAAQAQETAIPRPTVHE